jgi:SM-20-related protein
MKKQFSANDLSLLDDAITPQEQKQLSEAFSGALWRYDWPVNSAPLVRPFWHFFIAGSQRQSLACCEDELADHERWGFLIDIWKRISTAHMQNSRLIGVYANGQTWGQDSPIHRDNLPSEPGRTAVLFCNDYWTTTWSGELLFCNNAKTDVITAVLPKPGRIVIFDGEMPHRAKSPSIDCDRLRTTIAFKTVNKDFIL